MTDLPISKDLAARLQQLARNNEKSLEDILTDLVSQQEAQNVIAAQTFLTFAEELEKLNLHSGQSDISSNFDDYAKQAVADHFKRRLKEE